MFGGIFIGASGFFYPHWRGVFYPSDLPQKDWFRYYSWHFKTVEINSSFYHLPKKSTFEKWGKEVSSPAHQLAGSPTGGFVFSVKGWRWITHFKRLKNCQEEIKKFIEALSGLTPSPKNVILWQFPPRMVSEDTRLKGFLATLPSGFRHAFEFRNPSWLNDKVFALLRQNKAAVVIQDFPEWPITEKLTADFVYLRFHGRTSLYSSCYTEGQLVSWARKIKKWQRKGLDTYVYFNNDALGYAVKNAKSLIQKCQKL
jgi:uncharacterized protein YecE (DUF72 family)